MIILLSVQRVPRLEIRFTQRELRETFGWGDRQLRRHLHRLIDLEYILVYRTGHGNGKEYSLLYDGQGKDGAPFLLGLLDASELRKEQAKGLKKRTGGKRDRKDPHSVAVSSAEVPHSARPKNGASRSTKKTSRRKSAK